MENELSSSCFLKFLYFILVIYLLIFKYILRIIVNRKLIILFSKNIEIILKGIEIAIEFQKAIVNEGIACHKLVCY